MKEFIKKITIVFLIISFILSSVNISVFQVFASEISDEQEISNTVVESNENDLLELDESDNQEGESKKSAENKNGSDDDADSSKEESTDADEKTTGSSNNTVSSSEGTTGSGKNTASSSEDTDSSSKNTANLDEGKDGSDNNSTGSDKNPENSNGNSTTPNENLNNSKDDSEDSEETSNNANEELKESKENSNQVNGENSGSVVTDEIVNDEQYMLTSLEGDSEDTSKSSETNMSNCNYYYYYTDSKDDEGSADSAEGTKYFESTDIQSAIKEAESQANGKSIVIKINKDFSLSSTMTFETNLNYIIDLNKHVLTIDKGYRFIDIESSATVTIKNGTLKGGENTEIKIDPSISDPLQAGIQATLRTQGIISCKKGTLTIDNLIIEENKAKGKGIVNIQDGELIAKHSTIKNNTAATGGGIYLSNAKCKITDCTIEGNEQSTASGMQGGTGIGVYNAFLEADNLRVISNGCGCGTACGGIYIQNSNEKYTVTLTDSLISNNQGCSEPSGAFGAGMTVTGGKINLKNTVIKNNTGYDCGGVGIYPYNSNIEFNMEGGAIYNNTANSEYSDTKAFAHDIIIGGTKSANVSIPAANQMTDDKADIVFSDYCWGSNESKQDYNYETKNEEISLETEKNERYLYTASDQKIRNIAEVKEKQYTTIQDAIKKAENGDTIKLIAGEDGRTARIVNEEVSMSENKSITIDLNGRTWNGGNNGKKALIIEGEKADITITGEGSITEIDYKKGSLTLNSSANIDKIYLEKGQQVKVGNDFPTNNTEWNITFVLYSSYQEDIGTQDIVLMEGNKNILEELLKKIKIEGVDNSIIIKEKDNGKIVAHKLKAIYISGTNGSDTKKGDTAEEAVSTFNKVEEILKENDEYEAVFVTNTVKINGEGIVLSLSKNIPVCRYSNCKGYLIDITGNVTLKNITIDGQGDKVEARDALIKVESGATLNIEYGTELKNNNHTNDSNYPYEAGGAVYCDDGTINMNGGIVSGNKCWYGAGIHINGNKSVLNMRDGEISNNEIIKGLHGNGGGGVAVTQGATFNMYEGNISYNKSTVSNGIGGGILIGEKAYIETTTVEESKLNMYGGKISNNSALLDGGGIYIQSKSTGRIDAGEISYNKCTSTNVSVEGDYGGGGIYVNGRRKDVDEGKLYISNAYIANNTANGGSAIAGCGTSTVIIHPEGATIYNDSTENNKSQIYVDSTTETGYGTEAEIDISRYSVGGVLNHWYDIDKEKELTYEELSNLKANEKIEIINNNNAENLESDEELFAVKIIGNTAQRSGGGIGTNGYVEIGDETITTDVTVTKKWQDGKNCESTRPQDIEVTLYANGEQKNTEKLTADGNWTHTFKNLKKYTDKDEKIEYTVEEVNVSGYLSEVDGYNIKNIIPTSITVTKKWNDGEDKYGKRPESVTIHLLADGEIIETESITEEDNWTYTFENIPKYNESGDEIEYTITEDEVAGYKSVIKDKEITNTLLTNITVTKTWNDGNNKYEKRPGSIKVQLLENGKVIKSQDVTADTDWSYTFDELPRFDKDGNEIVYTIDEENVDNYIKEIDGYNLINTYYIDINGTKTWDDKKNQDGKRPDSIIVYLLKNGERAAQQEVTESVDWEYSFKKLPKYDGDKEIEYSIDEEEVDGYSKKIEGYNITNTHTPETIDIDVTKTWDDKDNQDGKRPEKITVHLYADGKEIKSEDILATEGNEWKYSFTGLPRYSEGHEIVYTIDESGVEGYTKKINGYNITNSYTPETININGRKTWNDKDNQDGKRPDKITVYVLANGEKVASKDITEADNWEYSFTNLPKYSKGHEIVYTVDESEVEDYNKKIDGYNLINSYDPETVDISGRKIWNDNENQDGKRPDKIIVNLLANGEKIDSKEVTEADKWEYSFTGLPRYKKGQKIQYTIDEDQVVEYTKEVNEYNLTNTHTPETVDISGIKTWNDNEDQDGKRPDSITVYLLADGEQKYSKEVTEADAWAYSFEGLPKYSEGQEIEYTVDEGDVENYTKEINEYNITNTHTPETVVIGGTKTWKDNDNQDGRRPDKIIIHIYADGQEVDSKEVTETDEWKYLFTGLPKYSKGQEIKYTIDEEIVAEYTKEVDGYNVTNTHIPETIDISGTKTWNDNDNQDGKRPDKIIIHIYADGQEVDSKEVTEADEWSYLFTGLPKYSKGQEINYTIDEEEVEGYTKEIDGYNVTNTHIPEIIDISGTKIWDDNDNQDGKRPEKITVYLLANGEIVDLKEVTEADEWKYSFTGLAKYNKGQEIMYTIDEEAVAEYTKEIDGYNLINTHIPKDIDEDIDDNEDINTKPEAPKEYPKTGDNILMNITVWLISIITGIVIIKKEIFN